MIETMGQIIRRLRKERNLTQEELAQQLNVTFQAISRWENGTALPDAQNILQISKLFNVTTDYLLNDDYESDNDIPAVKTATAETDAPILINIFLSFIFFVTLS